ncbi:acyl-CoA dehydrogenase/oxidase [Lobosporangium transversale]|uniref:Acyl-coenzyme A oxidase n=1 Tax=Lobosporangium transversale TaxID=64571 RepID=A0A1Y2GHY4_9FUNG|nr:acyl-CoA dehydrogenase/oxidase [Lobosporangium transversale]ORZ10277.1 acyl-CoA dehydrogenase/oxidase [Lobosporangium transversale]|eukprot:XP_021879184.1 acyl-CoA dehydrogenase/oxidase [Lobosporangium transversale]
MPPFIPPLSDRSKTVSSLNSERALVSFNVESLSQFLYGENFEKRRHTRDLVEQHPVFSNADKPFLSRERQYVRSLEKAAKLVEMRKQNNWSDDDMMMAMMVIGDSTPQFLHEALFIPTLKTQLTDEQQKIWLPKAQNYEIFGCYVQTEMAHGSNLRKLETTATFIPETDEFEIDTPTLNSMKWWPGALAQTSTHCAIYARLTLHGKDYGVHPFLLQIRAAGTHAEMPGIELGNLGPKIGFNTIDNGFLRINKVRIPREQMMMRNSRVTRDGKYEPAKNAKMNYSTMVAIRANIVKNAGFALGQSLTVAIRYSMIRLQGGDRIPSQKGEEVKVIDHGMQRFRLTTSLALSYAMLMTGRVMTDMHQRNLKNVIQGEVGLMAEVHATSSGLKALISDLATAHMEDVRRSCGGHGYAWCGGMVEVLTTTLQDVTVEGENTILHLQTSRWLLKTILQALKTKDLSSVPAGLQPTLQKGGENILDQEKSIIVPGQPISGEALIAAFWHREARAMAKSQVRMVELSRTHGEGMLVRNFYEAIQKEEQAIHQKGGDVTKGYLPVLKMLFELHSIHRLLEQAGDFMEDGYVSRQQKVWCKDRREQLIDLLRYELIGLVDAYDFSDNQLNSAIGRYDGRVYESLYEWAKYGMTLVDKGKNGGVLGFDEVLKDLFAEGRRLNGAAVPKL